MYSVRQKASVTLANRNVGSGKNREKWMLERYPINYTSIKNLLNKLKKKKKKETLLVRQQGRRHSVIKA